ncbi:MAG: hypothetical protein PVG65_03430 [Candidatus Thorarchaeota archaeon]|jgi:hypothetical protein
MKIYEQSCNQPIGVYLKNQILREALRERWEKLEKQQKRIKDLLNKEKKE